MKEEWWLTAAGFDDTLVAELLLRLKDSSVKPLPPPTWGLRQPRSSMEKKRDARRRSPTTPLSWGGAASPSDCYDDYSSHHGDHPSQSDRFRSKISAFIESPTTSGKRLSRKKTFAELKEQECSLLKEQTYLKRELATLRSTLVEQKSMNDNLKRRKLDLPIESGTKPEAYPTEPKERNTDQNRASEATSSNVSKCKTSDEPTSFSSQEPSFELPDLNMMPDEDCGQEGIVGMS